MKPRPSKKATPGRTLVALVRGRLREELLDARGELRLHVALDRGGPCPELFAIAENRTGDTAERFLVVFKTDRLALEEALAQGTDPLAQGDLVYLDYRQARQVAEAAERVFGRREAAPEPQGRRSKRAASSARRETPRSR